VKELQFIPIVHKVKFFWNSFTATAKWVDPTRSSPLIRRGIARFFGGPLEIWSSPPLREIDEVAARVKKQLGY
jgi:hypothetical protein